MRGRKHADAVGRKLSGALERLFASHPLFDLRDSTSDGYVV